jgi:hypothetical protein
MSSIVLTSGKKIRCKAITKTEYDKLKKASVGGIIDKLKEKYDIETYVLKTGQAIVAEKDYYTLYNSLDDLKLVLNDASAGNQGVEVLRNVNIYGSDFPGQTSNLVRQLCVDLDAPFEQFDMNLLSLIDQKISDLRDPESFNEDHLINYIALIGEVVKEKYHGTWDMQLASDGQTWNPYLQINNERVQFFTYLYEDIVLNYHNGNRHIIIEIYKTVEDIIKNQIRWKAILDQ